jgi:acyl carrier protein
MLLNHNPGFKLIKNKMEIKNRVLKVFSLVFQKNADEIKITDDKESIETWDSISHLFLIMNLEEEFNIKLKTEDVVKIDSVKTCIRYIENILNGSRTNK